MPQIILKYGIMIAGSLLIAVGTNTFLVPYKVLDGGVIGLALIANYAFGWQIGSVILLLSIPIFIATWCWDRDIFYNSLSGMLISSLVIDLLTPLQEVFHPGGPPGSEVSAVLGGSLVGAGLGLMLRFETSTGGTDLAAYFLSRWFSLNKGFLILVMDMVIITIGTFMLPEKTFVLSMYTITAGAAATGLCTLSGRKKPV